MTTKVGADDFIVSTAATPADFDALPREEVGGPSFVSSYSDLGPETWPTLAPGALYGFAGHIVKALDPYTEADPVATLAPVLVAGREPGRPGAARARST